MDGRRKNSLQDSELRTSAQLPLGLACPLAPAVLPDNHGGFIPCPALLTEEELVRFLRIPEVSGAQDHHHVVENLKRMHGLPRIHLCGKVLYPRQAIEEWIRSRTDWGK